MATKPLLISEALYRTAKDVLEKVRSGKLAAAEPIWCLYSAIEKSWEDGSQSVDYQRIIDDLRAQLAEAKREADVLKLNELGTRNVLGSYHPEWKDKPLHDLAFGVANELEEQVNSIKATLARRTELLLDARRYGPGLCKKIDAELAADAPAAQPVPAAPEPVKPVCPNFAAGDMHCCDPDCPVGPVQPSDAGEVTTARVSAVVDNYWRFRREVYDEVKAAAVSDIRANVERVAGPLRDRVAELESDNVELRAMVSAAQRERDFEHANWLEARRQLKEAQENAERLQSWLGKIARLAGANQSNISQEESVAKICEALKSAKANTEELERIRVRLRNVPYEHERR